MVPCAANCIYSYDSVDLNKYFICEDNFPFRNES